MTVTYGDYIRALQRLRDLPEQTESGFQQAGHAYAHAVDLAARATTAANAAGEETTDAIEAQLKAARAALESIGRASLIPPRIRPSDIPKAATSADVAEAQKALSRAVTVVRDSVQAELRRIEIENERLAREAADRLKLEKEAAARAAAQRARRRRLMQISVATAVTTVILLVILTLIL